jgi:mannose-1-phosphate guanylyltransferase/mannose-6-phosphate isomerase
MKLVPTLLCGGSGSRLWPASRKFHPKPFIRLADGQSLLQKAWLRGAALPGVAEVVTVTNRELIFQTEDEYREVACMAPEGITNSFILEPFGRYTAPAIAAAAVHLVAAHGDDVLMLVLAADHLISDQAAFAAAAAKAIQLAQQGKLVTFGIQPVAPETGYGYIEVEGGGVLRFVEKPNLKQAVEYIASGRYLWNSGMFCFAAGAVLREMERHCPAILAATRVCVEQATTTAVKESTRIELAWDTFGQVPDDSIDYAVMEKSEHMAVVPCSIGWSDIGSWDAIGNLIEPDGNGNRIEAEVQLHDVSNCFIQSNVRMVGAVGVSNLIIVDTPDALLVADHSRAQDVRHLYASLKARDHDVHKLHRTVHRPWGTFTVLEEGRNFKIKRIEVKPGASLSLQLHYHRSEHWVVVSGTARVVNGDDEIIIRPNESTYIPAGHKHRLENPGLVDVVMIEVQSGEYLGEDDIVRFKDNYGRA